MRKRFLAAWIVIEAICAAILLAGLYLGQNKADLIILYGIRAANAAVAAVIIVAVAAMAVSCLLFAGAYRKKYRPVRQPKPAPVPPQDAVNVNSEGYIRGKLEHFWGARPRLHGELTECMRQMDSINEKLASLAEVRARNSAGFLEVVAESLEKAKRSIWENMQAIINIAEIWDPKEAGDPEWSNVYGERRASIKARIKLNDDLLKQSASLLTKGTVLANDKTLTRKAEDDLSATIETIDKLRSMSGIAGGER